MSTEALMLDSGAFAVWTRGMDVDLEAYIRFCQEYPDVSYYVNLDVIPGKPNDIMSMTDKNIESACQQGWENYQYMLDTLPLEKVIPVFHQGDDPRWLVKMVEFGAPYVGISPANDRTTSQRSKWLTGIKKHVTDSKGKALVKMHGFAVTSHRLMSSFPWYSVDSATWTRCGGLGKILVPRKTAGLWDYTKQPWMINVSDKSPSRGKRNEHLFSCSPLLRKHIEEFMEENGVGLGKWVIKEAKEGEKLERGFERWLDKSKKQIIRVLVKGVATDDQRRKWLNMRYYQKAAEALPLTHIFLAGFGGCKKIERDMRSRLLSYYEINRSPEFKKFFEYHVNVLAAENADLVPF